MQPDIVRDLPQTSVTHRDPIRSAVMRAHTSTRQSPREGLMPHQIRATHVTCAAEGLRQPRMGRRPVSQDRPGLYQRRIV
jgi:hypothetical protein